MSFKILMVDVDGVVVHRPDGRRWDADLQADLGIDPDALQSRFFAPHWWDISHGRADLIERLAPVLEEIAPRVTAEALMAYWFAKDAHQNQPLLDDLAALRAAGTPMWLATVQDHRRAAYLWDTLGFRDRFEGVLHSALIGHSKPDGAYFNAVAERLAALPGDLLLIDDSARNIEAAIAAGWQARRWSGEKTLAEVLAD
ncbi:MAG: HAD-IA family hydrolase [Caulobacteraceae bacterium]